MPDSLKFQLELVDKMTKPGKEMAAQLAKLKLQLNAANQAVKQTEAALNKLQKAKVVDIATYRKLTAELEHNRAAQNGYRQSILSLAAPQADHNEQMTESVTKGVLLGNIYTKLGEVAFAAGRKIVELGIGGAELAIHAVELKMDTLDALEAFVGTAEAAKEIYGRIEDMQGQVAMSQERGMGLARELSAAGVTNKDALVDAIQAIGQVESVLGGGAGGRIQSIIERSSASGKFKFNAKQLAGTGVQSSAIAAALGMTPAQMDAQMKAGKITAEQGIAALAKAVSQKFAGVAGKQVLDIGNQFQHFKDNVSKLFEDVNTDGFLSALHDVLSMFDQSTESGRILKTVITDAFNGMFKIVAEAGPTIKWLFKEMIILALRFYIAMRPVLSAIKNAFSGESLDIVKTFKAVFGPLAEDIIGVVSALSILVGWVITVDAWILHIINSVMDFKAGMEQAGGAIIGGLVNGIKNGAGAAVDAVKQVASDMLNNFIGHFKIGSPSKVMAEMGGHLMSGLGQGIDQGSAGAQASMSDAMSSTPVAKSSGGGGGNKSVSVTVAPGAIVISGVQNAQQVADMLPEMFANAVEELMMEKGVAA